MDAFLPGFSPYYPPDDPEDVLPLEQDALLWFDSLTVLPDPAEPDAGSTSSDARQPPSLVFDSAPSGSSTSGSGTSQSPEDHSGRNVRDDHSNDDGDGDGGASSEDDSSSGSSSAEGARRGKKARITLDPRQPLTVKGKPRARVYVACREW